MAHRSPRKLTLDNTQQWTIKLLSITPTPHHLITPTPLLLITPTPHLLITQN
ncbi:hypothetical protein IQ215_13660 [Cyanobacterium stanieri LEGE 03274]|uniref:Uncharacterized protein n=1 Tax=Cyanobacterium stanieri LEGE 03274 TaxID=1828756 RepID=A0ABR9V777_9CHRO|nr:hypothetical protein [Cyanobacterium stanieri]MBE9223745.1 hypothetical protein [Cyanobacterium stanieri LEGE 03274]